MNLLERRDFIAQQLPDILRNPLPARVQLMPAIFFSLGISCCRALLVVLIALSARSACGASALLPSSPQSYLDQAARVRQSTDRPWAPEAGRLGNLRHLQVTARDCVVRVVSGSENRVLPGTRAVIVVERSRVLDSNPNEQPIPRDVVLATDHAQACPGPGSCGVSITSVTSAPPADAKGSVCFTVQLATAHDLLLGGDGLTLLVDRVRQPALRIAVNPSARVRIWLEQVNVGLLSIDANAPVQVGGHGQADFLQLASSNGASAMFMHDLHAHNVGVSTTTTGTQWSIRIDADTKAGYYQPARAPGSLASNYGIEIDGRLDRLEVPAGSVVSRALSQATRLATRALRDAVLAQAGPAPNLSASDLVFPSAVAAVQALPSSPRQRVADVASRYLPQSVRITDLDLWKQGGRLEGEAPDAGTTRAAVEQLAKSGEFIEVSGGASVRDGRHIFSLQLHFSCNAPGEPSVCPPGDHQLDGAYSETQVIETIGALLGPTVSLQSARLAGDKIEVQAQAANEAEARAGLERLGQRRDFFRVSVSGYRPGGSGSPTPITATLELTCATPPKPDGICTARTAALPRASLSSE